MDFEFSDEQIAFVKEVETFLDEHDDLAGTIRELTGGRGPDAVIDAVGMEAHGSPVAGVAHKLAGLLPDKLAQPMMQNLGVSKLAARE